MVAHLPGGSAVDCVRPPFTTSTIIASPGPASGRAAGLTNGQGRLRRPPRARHGGDTVAGGPGNRHTAIVTGANHGIGAAVATALAEHGCAVLCTYLRVDDPA